MSKQTDFINKHKKDVIIATYGTNIFPSVKMAQMILESGWGEDAPVKLANNYFGIKKGVGWNGETIELKTSKDAQKVNVFRKYPNALDSIKDHSNFLLNNKRYENAGVFNAKTPEEQIKAIAKAGYAEDKNYPNTIISIINSNKLKDIDEEAKKYKPKAKIFKQKTNYKVVFLTSLIVFVTYKLYKKYK